MKKWSKELIAKGVPLRKMSRELLLEESPAKIVWEQFKQSLTGEQSGPPSSGTIQET